MPFNTKNDFGNALTLARVTFSPVPSCGSVGRAVTTDTRGLHFVSSHRQTFILKTCLL